MTPPAYEPELAVSRYWYAEANRLAAERDAALAAAREHQAHVGRLVRQVAQLKAGLAMYQQILNNRPRPWWREAWEAVRGWGRTVTT